MSAVVARARADRGALLFACLFPSFATWLYFIRLAGNDQALPVFAVTKTVQFAFPILWVLMVEGWRRPPATGSGKGLLFGLASGLVFVLLLLALWRPLLAASPVFAGAPAAVAAKVTSLGVDSDAKFLLMAAFYSLIHSYLEEYYWRWFVFGRLRRELSFGAAALLSSLAFTAHHVLVVGHFLGRFGLLTFLLSLVVTAVALFWTWLYERTGRLTGLWLSHALADAGLMWIGYRMWQGW